MVRITQKGDKGQTRDLFQSLALCENKSQPLEVVCEKSD